jgi:hypothetical protein
LLSVQTDALGGLVPEISRFFGIAIAVYYRDHERPRFAALAGPFTVEVEIETGAVAGRFPPRALGLVLEWRERHVPELLDNWARARERRPLRAVPPLE